MTDTADIARLYTGASRMPPGYRRLVARTLTGKDFIGNEDKEWPPLVSAAELYPERFDDYWKLVQEGYWENGIRMLEENGYE